MTRRRVAALLVLVCVAGETGLAHADCAWVLWAHAFGRDDAKKLSGEQLQPWDAYSTKRECEIAMGVAKKQPRPPSSEVFFTCLPDAVDPRGPKGGTR